MEVKSLKHYVDRKKELDDRANTLRVELRSASAFSAAHKKKELSQLEGAISHIEERIVSFGEEGTILEVTGKKTIMKRVQGWDKESIVNFKFYLMNTTKEEAEILLSTQVINISNLITESVNYKTIKPRHIFYTI